MGFLLLTREVRVFGQEIFAECFGADEFLVVNEQVNFDTAVERCFNLQGVVGVTFNQEEFDKVVELGSNVGGEIFLGMFNLQLGLI